MTWAIAIREEFAIDVITHLQASFFIMAILKLIKADNGLAHIAPKVPIFNHILVLLTKLEYHITLHDKLFRTQTLHY